MKGFQLEFFMEQNKRHKHEALWKWLLEAARTHGIRGATSFQGSMGYGQHRRVHAAHFFELADQPVEVTMVVTETEAESFLALLREEKVHLFYVKLPVEFGILGEENG
ncbi:MAG: DUF190 domain-containing protein [Burkholderiaceae bacterium]|nr:DUF190 domain-containing protein [Burkholderiaceae bacterium]